jgi:hypothetical protein
MSNLVLLQIIHFILHPSKILWTKSAYIRGAVGWGSALQAKRSRVRFPMVSEFFIDCGPGVDSRTDRNEYREYLLGVKAVGA